MNEIHVTIDGREVIGTRGETILELARRAGIEIPTLCHDDQLAHYGACGLCVVEAEKTPKLLRSCSQEAMDGQVIHTDTERVKRARKLALELIMSDHEGDCVGPCSLRCPAHTDCQGYVKQIALGNDRRAVEIMHEVLPLPASIARVCPHPCEEGCRRKLVEQPISIADLKGFAADQILKTGVPALLPKQASTGKTVAIVGGGPAGLAAAHILCRKGHDVTVFDAMDKMGGMLRYGIPEYRLPKAVLDSEVAELADYGIHMKNNLRLGKDITLEELRKTYNAVILAVGAWQSTGVGCTGSDLPGVLGGIDFLRDVVTGHAPAIGDSVAIVGGGNTAMDACRTAIRLGAAHVYVIYRRTRAEMPAAAIEIEEAIEEGVEFRFLSAPAEILAGPHGRAATMKLQIMELGEPDASGRRSPVPVEGKFELLPVTTVIAAIGQKFREGGTEEVQKNKRGNIETNELSAETKLPGVFAAGDATNRGAGIAIEAVAEGCRAAESADAFLTGREAILDEPYRSERHPTEADYLDKAHISRAVMPVRPADERRKDFRAVTLGLSEEVARAEAKRCLECGCHDYKDCKLIRYANTYPIAPDRLSGKKHPCFKEERLVSIRRDQGKCILCGLCVRVCAEEAKVGLLGLVGRGFNTVIKPEFRDETILARCKDCRKCAERCPTGALQILTEKE